MLILPCELSLAKTGTVKHSPNSESVLRVGTVDVALSAPQPVDTLALAISCALYRSLEPTLCPEEAPD